jgi:hypothetical protein
MATAITGARIWNMDHVEQIGINETRDPVELHPDAGNFEPEQAPVHWVEFIIKHPG